MNMVSAPLGRGFSDRIATLANDLLSLIGQAFDGSVRPLAVGFIILGVLALLTVLTVERGALFKEG